MVYCAIQVAATGDQKFPRLRYMSEFMGQHSFQLFIIVKDEGASAGFFPSRHSAC